MFNRLPWAGLVDALIAPAGTRIAFNQASAPIGWTQDTSTPMSDCSMRLVVAAGGGSAGSTVWSNWNFGGTFGVNAFTIDIAHMPAHNHTDAGHSHGVSDPTHQHIYQDNNGANCQVPTTNVGTQIFLQSGGNNSILGTHTGPAATGVSVQTGAANIQNNGGGAALTPNYTTPQVKYTDFIMGVKS